jgi:hypothetical protein
MSAIKALFFVCALATPALAVVDPTPDTIGIYFDLDADQNSLIVPPSVPFSAYAILTNPTEAQVSAFELSYRVEIAPAMTPYFFRLNLVVGWAGSFIPEPIYDVFADEIMYGAATPLPTTEATVLVQWQYMLLAHMIVGLYLGPTTTQPGGGGVLAYYPETDPVPMTLITGDPEIPVAVINELVDPVTPTSFGALKALYR